jgi:RNA polymerase sigma factor (sigma-70 family)
MTPSSSQLRTVTDRLPFPIDDTDAANQAFRQWRANPTPDTERVVEMWTYCYVCRYFLAKAAGDAFDRAAAPDELITRTYEKVRDNIDSVRDADQFASWVSVVCKNTFLNYTRRNRTAKSINDAHGPVLKADAPEGAEMRFVEELLGQAIERLPEYLREPARLYFLEDRTFEEISDAIGKPVPTVRTYKHKAVKKLREDNALREYIEGPEF